MIIENARYAFWKGLNVFAFLDVMHKNKNNNKFVTKLIEDKTYIDIFAQNDAYIDKILLIRILLTM